MSQLAIKMYMHCTKCIRERPSDIAPRDWARLNVGWTEQGLQIWCVRHNINVAHIDLQGNKVTVDSSIAPHFCIPELGENDIGRWVEYRSKGGDKVEQGRIKSWNDERVFVVYQCGGDWDNFAKYTGVATDPADLRFIDTPKAAA